MARVIVAEKLLDRMVGLLGRGSLAPGRGMWIARCPAIHTWFMLFRIDVIFLDNDLKVVRRVDGVGPFRTVHGGPGARSTLEVASGWLTPNAARKGDRLVVAQEHA